MKKCEFKIIEVQAPYGEQVYPSPLYPELQMHPDTLSSSTRQEALGSQVSTFKQSESSA